jgi:hypothetical protein
VSIHKGFIIILAGLFLSSCATHHSARIAWEGERIRLEFTPPDAGSPVLKCLSCNEELAPLPLQVNDHGIAYIKIDEARNALVSHFRLTGSGIDTALILQQPVPNGYKDSLIGRIMAVRYTIIYKDTSLTESVGSLERKDEVNLFGKDDVFYYIHEPGYNFPVVILKSHAVTIQ